MGPDQRSTESTESLERDSSDLPRSLAGPPTEVGAREGPESPESLELSWGSGGEELPLEGPALDRGEWKISSSSDESSLDELFIDSDEERSRLPDAEERSRREEEFRRFAASLEFRVVLDPEERGARRRAREEVTVVTLGGTKVPIRTLVQTSTYLDLYGEARKALGLPLRGTSTSLALVVDSMTGGQRRDLRLRQILEPKRTFCLPEVRGCRLLAVLTGPGSPQGRLNVRTDEGPGSRLVEPARLGARGETEEVFPRQELESPRKRVVPRGLRPGEPWGRLVEPAGLGARGETEGFPAPRAREPANGLRPALERGSTLDTAEAKSTVSEISPR